MYTRLVIRHMLSMISKLQVDIDFILGSNKENEIFTYSIIYDVSAIIVYKYCMRYRFA